MEVSSTWFQKPRVGPFWPGDESLSDGLCADSCWTGRQRAVAGGGPISDAARLPLAERDDHFAAIVFAQLTHRESLRGISYVDPETGLALVFLTNQFELDALIVALIYRRRWAIELLFRWIKQHLRLRGLFSTSSNGVRVQIWAAMCAFLLVAIAKQRKNLTQSLWGILQVVSVRSLE
jgi:hypothetical protein